MVIFFSPAKRIEKKETSKPLRSLIIKYKEKKTAGKYRRHLAHNINRAIHGKNNKKKNFFFSAFVSEKR
jgi:hypothetical protein